jgi:hypothetical protein
MTRSTYESVQPWVVYTYLRTDAEADRLGIAIEMLCTICGEKEVAEFPMPSSEDLAALPADYKHPLRVAFLEKHVHRLQQKAPETWALPLLNPAAHGDTMDILRDVAERAVRQGTSEPVKP